MTDPANPIATKLNQLPKHVVTKTLNEASWQNSSIVRDVAQGVSELKRRYGDVISRISFYAPYKNDPDRWRGVLDALKAA